MTKFAGLTVALVAPFKDGAVDYDALLRLVSWHIEQGTDCLAPTGTTGESPTLDHEEHEHPSSISPSTRCWTTASGGHPDGESGHRQSPDGDGGGIEEAVLDREFRRLVVARPTISMGKELGFLPGSLDEKLAPWMQPIHDALEMLSDLNMGHEHRRSNDLMRSGSIVVEALSYIRGRSIAHQFMVIDEAQNLTPLEVKTIITRVGHGTKIIFTGDPYQIDNPYVDSSSNGFNYIISKFRGEAVAAHIELQKANAQAGGAGGEFIVIMPNNPNGIPASSTGLRVSEPPIRYRDKIKTTPTVLRLR